MDKNILDSIVDFFKSTGHKKPSGGPINVNWDSGAYKKQSQDETNLAQEKMSQRALQGIDKESHVELLVDVKNDSEASETMFLKPSELQDNGFVLPLQLVRLQTHYSWRILKANKALP